MASVQSICEINGCGKRVKARKLCYAHYKRLMRHGDPRAGGGYRAATRELSECLELAVASATDECIVWPFGKDKDGYGKVGGNLRAHRVVLERTAGSPPTPAHEAAHAPGICHNPSCINPRHLRWATTRENYLDRTLDGTDNSGERAHLVKLTEEQVAQIRTRIASGEPLAALAKDFSVTYQSIRNIKLGKTWRPLQNKGALNGEASGAEIR